MIKAFVKSYEGLVACRTLLGFFESGKRENYSDFLRMNDLTHEKYRFLSCLRVPGQLLVCAI